MTNDAATIARLSAGAHALVDLDAYTHNIQTLRDMLPAGMAFMAVVKADGYGHGAAHCAAAARAAGAAWLGVARIDEALRLRATGDAGPLLVLGPPNPNQIADAFQHSVTITLGAREALSPAVDAAKLWPGSVHLKVDTGMRRYGFMPDEVVNIVKQLSGVGELRIDGIFTHFAMADDRDPAPTDVQLARFDAALAALDKHSLRPPLVHVANSAAILAGRLGQTNLARSGIATYGLSPSADVAVDGRFQPVLSIKAPVARVFELAAGDGVSYGWTYHSIAPQWAGVAPIGYADGLPRSLSNVGWVGVSGERRAVLGRVCMDQMVVEVAGSTRVGDLIDVMGGAGMSADEIGHLAGTLNYEVVARLAARVPRIYLRNGKHVAWAVPANCAAGDFPNSSSD